MILVVLVGLLALLAWAYFQKRRDNFPPGPVGFPILGHLPFLGQNGHKVMMKWAQFYGPLVGIRFGSYRAVVIQDPKLIRNALSLSAFSGRPMLNLFTASASGIFKGLVINEGNTWAEQRRFVQANMKTLGVGVGTKSMETRILDEAVEMLERLNLHAGKPIPAKEAFSSAVLNVLWDFLFSERLNLKDPEVASAAGIIAGFTEDTSMMAGLSIFIPWIARYFPKISGYEKMIQGIPILHQFMENQIRLHKRHHIPGQPRDFVDSYTDKTLATTDQKSSFHPQHNEMPCVLVNLFSAGIDTVTTTLTCMCAYLIHHPMVQKKLRDESYQVIGKDRLPCLADRDRMHYTEAVISKVLRYSSVFPLSIFHNIAEDTRFQGYYLPKDTMVIPNLFGCHFDVKLWGDPENFRPERFLGRHGKFCKNDNLVAFSAGKRVCPGESLAKKELFLFTTCLFQKFVILNHGDLPSLEPKIGMTACLPPFEMILKER